MEIEDAWRAYLLGNHPQILRARRLFGRLPSEPRCRVCQSPFHGLGSLFLARLGVRPWEKNPNICRRCITTMSRYGAGGAEVELSMVFADVRGSTTMAEHVSGTEFSALLNRFYDAASRALLDHDAVIDKFVGDEVIGLFLPMAAGGDHAARSIDAARAILAATGHGDPAGPWIPVGIGVHTGVARVGLVGSLAGMMDFTALGDSVNTAARLASQAGVGEVLVSDAAAAAAGLSPAAGEHRELHLKGRTESVRVTVLAVTDAGAPA